MRAILICFLACSHAPPKGKVPAHLFHAEDDGDGIAELLSITVGAVNAAAGCAWFGVGTPGVLVRTDDAFLHGHDVPNGANAIGYYDGEGTITLRTQQYSGWGRPASLLHEMGHAVGLAHEPGTIMDPELPNWPYDEAVRSLVVVATEHGKFACP